MATWTNTLLDVFPLADSSLPAGAPRLVLLLILLILGVANGVIGVLGARGRLPRNRFGGVRTAAALRSTESFRLANRVAGPPLIASGAVGVLAGVATALAPSAAAMYTIALLGLAGVLALAIGGGVLGNRAAARLPEPAPEMPDRCAGCACGSGGCFARQAGGPRA